MESIASTLQKLRAGGWDTELVILYGKDALSAQRLRYQKAIEQFQKTFPSRTTLQCFSSPGRTELGGNHTDHQHGCVLAAAIHLDILAMVSVHEEPVIRVCSEGFGTDIIDLDDLTVKPEEYNTTAALVRGVAAKCRELGLPVVGFDAYLTSDIPKGAGLSSSAAFENLIGTILNYNTGEVLLDDHTIADISQYAENVYFHKACGKMDQMVIAAGGVHFIDFINPAYPLVESVPWDEQAGDMVLCVVNTLGDHADLSEHYSAIPQEMKQVAAHFGCEVLRHVEPEQLLEQIPALRHKLSDRAVLRALHFCEENRRVQKQVNALWHGDFDEFLFFVQQSGDSSYKFLQNIYCSGETEHQNVAIGLAVSEAILQGQGVCRVHGGGFAGTIQAYVPKALYPAFEQKMEQIFAKNCCHVLRIRPYGSMRLF